MRAGRLAAAITIGVVAGGLTAMLSPPARAQARAAEPVTVSVLGMYHMGNPGQDLHNAKIDPVTTPAKQAQLDALARRLARFRPTVVAVERVSGAPDLADPKYPGFTAADLTRSSDERVQIGYRVAKLTGARVIAIDVQELPGEPSYFPYGPVAEWAKAHPAAQARLDAGQAVVAARMKTLEADQSRRSVTAILAGMNAPGPDGDMALHRGFYNGSLAYGSGDAQPGAELAGRWYTRNAKIFAKLMQATKPGDRVLVVYGAGHLYWLSQLAQETPGYRLEPAYGYLK